MNKRFAIHYNAEATDGGGGSSEVSATMTAPAQSEVAGSTESAPVFDGAYFSELNRKMETEGYDPSQVELDAYNDFASGIKKTPATNKPDQTATSKEEVKPSTDSQDPKAEIDVDKLVKEGKFNQWTAEESAAVEKAMSKVGAKSPRELLEKVDGALALAGKKGGEAGELAKTNQELQQKLASFEALQNDLAAGKPEAIQYLRDNFGLTLAQAKAEAAKAQESSEMTMPEGVIDTETFGFVTKMQKAFDEKMKAMEGKLTSFETAEKTRQEQIAQQAQQAQQAEKIRELRRSHVDAMVELSEKDPALYGVKSASVRELMTQYYATGKVDPRISNHLELLKFAHEKGMNNIQDAHTLKNASRMSQLLIEAEERGRKSVLEVGKPQSLSGMRNGTQGNQNPQSYTVEDVRKIEQGLMDPPKDWFVNGLLVREKVPDVPGLRKAVFGY